MGLKYDGMNASPNLKPVVYEDFDAVERSIFRLISTPRGTLPEFPNLGFELEHFFGLSEDSNDFLMLKDELIEQISTIVGTENVECDIRRTTYDTIDIDIVYIYNKTRKRMSVTIDSDSDRKLLFKNITLK